MKLKEFLKKNKDQLVAIGAKSAFLYIGDDNEKAIKEEFENYRKKQYVINNRSKANLKKIAPVIPAEEAEFRKQVHQLIEMVKPVLAQLEEVEESLKEYEKSLRLKETASRDYKSSKNYIETYVSTMDREVLDTYSRNTDKAVVAIVEGLEEGKYWLKSEYEKEHENEDDQ